MSECLDCAGYRAALEAVRATVPQRAQGLAKAALASSSGGADVLRRAHEEIDSARKAAHALVESAKESEGNARRKANAIAGRLSEIEGALSRLTTAPSWGRVLEEADLETYHNASGWLCFRRRLRSTEGETEQGLRMAERAERLSSGPLFDEPGRETP